MLYKKSTKITSNSKSNKLKNSEERRAKNWLFKTMGGKFRLTQIGIEQNNDHVQKRH